VGDCRSAAPPNGGARSRLAATPLSEPCRRWPDAVGPRCGARRSGREEGSTRGRRLVFVYQRRGLGSPAVPHKHIVGPLKAGTGKLSNMRPNTPRPTILERRVDGVRDRPDIVSPAGPRDPGAQRPTPAGSCHPQRPRCHAWRDGPLRAGPPDGDGAITRAAYAALSALVQDARGVPSAIPVARS
jgi:hypothetical protein